MYSSILRVCLGDSDEMRSCGGGEKSLAFLPLLAVVDYGASEGD